MALHRCLALRMSSLVLLLCCLGAMVSADPVVFFDLEDAETYFQGFIETYNKQYSSEEEKSMRFEIFKESLKRVNENNLKSDSPVFGITRFSDLTADERKAFTGLMSFPGDSVCNISAPIVGDAPHEFDWRDLKKVTPVKDQGQCGSCWAFSAVARRAVYEPDGNIESQFALPRDNPVMFSEGQLVDCDKVDQGCGGGLMDLAMSYIQKVGGIMSEEDYPYEPRERKCKFDQSKVYAKVIGCKQYRFKSEDELKDTLFHVGPLSVGVDAWSFFEYNKGILKDCETGSLNHGVLLVGYGTEDGVDYWVIKNSWGTSFGEDGYIRVQRNVNACDIMNPKGLITSAILE